MKIQATFPISTRFLTVFVLNHIRPRKSKQLFQFSLISEWLLKEILPDHARRSNVFNFDQFLNVFVKSYQTMQIEATFSILTHFWMVFVGNPTRPRNSILTRFWMVFERNPSKSHKSYQPF